MQEITETIAAPRPTLRPLAMALSRPPVFDPVEKLKTIKPQVFPNLGGRQAVRFDQLVDEPFMDTQKLCDVSNVQEAFHLDEVRFSFAVLPWSASSFVVGGFSRRVVVH